MEMTIYYDDLDFELEINEEEVAEAMADNFRRKSDIDGLKALRGDNSLEKFLFDSIYTGFIDEKEIKEYWYDEIKEYWYDEAVKQCGSAEDGHADEESYYRSTRV